MRILWPLISTVLIFDSIQRFILLLRRILVPASAEVVPPLLTKGCVVLIAARDESGTIGPTVAAIRSHLVEWPGSQIHVVADRCSDDTANEAAMAGANVAIRENGQMGKGAVIAWWLGETASVWQQCDSVLILDADSQLKPGCLQALRQSLARGHDAVQAMVEPATDTRAGRLAGWSEILMQRIDDESRRRCGWQVPLRGTGMAFRPELLAELAPKLHTMAEDLELDVLLAAHKASVTFVPDAVVIDPKPQNSAGAARQRARWLRGQFQVLRAYWREIIAALLTGGLSAWFLLPLLFLRPKTFLIALRLLLLLTSALIFLTADSLISTLFLMTGVVAGIGLILDLSYYLAAALVVDDRRKYLSDLVAVPRYFAMWIYSVGVMTVRRGWLRARS